MPEHQLGRHTVCDTVQLLFGPPESALDLCHYLTWRSMSGAASEESLLLPRVPGYG